MIKEEGRLRGLEEKYGQRSENNVKGDIVKKTVRGENGERGDEIKQWLSKAIHILRT
ncbi:uncharacterized protein ASCRUDRAFT_75569 [Ascoidea rubescens DSM 1968]|uniref:Uncharacterized protein n=1 Tax=Ascoidea rubescens DSM 1968 TaxID=1344418 RepID=A0A1D2VIX7_9ASCO|nr:hypothetical protein ASCRUDRAFT_75569 [Ascoidea rubescens DSM 1968]ODV61578.1 hypothetical protein ASCRUDRAFT_75569 [Ascoidea rubescens DSM 1968]